MDLLEGVGRGELLGEVGEVQEREFAGVGGGGDGEEADRVFDLVAVGSKRVLSAGCRRAFRWRKGNVL